MKVVEEELLDNRMEESGTYTHTSCTPTYVYRDIHTFMHTCMNSYIKQVPPLSHRQQRKGKMIFIHSFNPDISIAPPKSTTTQRRSRPQCRSLHDEALQATEYIQYSIYSIIYTVSQKKLCKIVSVRTSSTFINFNDFGDLDEKWLKFYATYTFSTSPHSRYRTTLLNTKSLNVTVSQENCETIPSELCSISIILIIFGRYMTK